MICCSKPFSPRISVSSKLFRYVWITGLSPLFLSWGSSSSLTRPSSVFAQNRWQTVVLLISYSRVNFYTRTAWFVYTYRSVMSSGRRYGKGGRSQTGSVLRRALVLPPARYKQLIGWIRTSGQDWCPADAVITFLSHLKSAAVPGDRWQRKAAIEIYVPF